MRAAETDHRLDRLLRDFVNRDAESATRAVEAGVLTLDDLDPGNSTHVEVVAARVKENGDEAPEKFHSKLETDALVCLCGKNPKLAGTVLRRLRRNPDEASTVIRAWVEYVSKGMLPSDWVPLLKKQILIEDLAIWDAVKAFLPPEVVATWASQRDGHRDAADKAEKEKQKKERAAQPPKIDPLIASLKSRDTRRLRKIQLEALKPARWEKAKEIWRGCGRDTRAHMVRLPWELVQHDAKDALECLFDGSDRRDSLTVSWPIPKSVFKSLTLTTQVRVLKHMIYSPSLEVEPRLSVVEVNQMLIGAVLADSDACRLAEWFQWLSKLKQIKKLASGPAKGSLTVAEEKILGVITSAEVYDDLESWLKGDQDTGKDVSYDLTLAQVDWCLNQPPTRRCAVARGLWKRRGFRSFVLEFTAREFEEPRFNHGN